MSIDKTELKNIKKAIDVEVKHQYIDIKGKKYTFSQYITSLARNYYKIPPKNKRWADMAVTFSNYNLMSTGERIKSIDDFQRLLVEEPPKRITKEIVPKDDKEREMKIDSPDATDVQFVKGVGPVLSKRLNSIHIFTAQDLLTYYPRDHIDFKTQLKIKDVVAGEDVTIFGTIKRVNTFNSKKNPKLSITTIHVYDGTGTIT